MLSIKSKIANQAMTQKPETMNATTAATASAISRIVTILRLTFSRFGSWLDLKR
jgi:hypothetical protein